MDLSKSPLVLRFPVLVEILNFYLVEYIRYPPPLSKILIPCGERCWVCDLQRIEFSFGIGYETLGTKNKTFVAKILLH